MIATKETDIRNYFVKELQMFKNTGTYVVIIIDRYYIEFKNSNNIDNFIEFLNDYLSNPKIIWFCDRNKSKHTNGNVQVINSLQDLKIHDRFLFIFDAEMKIYVKLLHMGGSIHGFNIGADNKINSNLPGIVDKSTSGEDKYKTIRITNIDEIDLDDETNSNNQIIYNIEKAYGKKDWGF